VAIMYVAYSCFIAAPQFGQGPGWPVNE